MDGPAKQQLCIILWAALSFISWPVKAEILIGFVDIPYLIDKAPQAMDAAKRLESEFAPRQNKINGLKSELEQLHKQLQSGAAKPADLETEMHKLERQLKRHEQEFREQLNIRKNSEFKKIRVIVLEAINTFVRVNRYDLIVSDGVLYANDSVDVTGKILQNLEQLDRADQ